MRRDLVGRIHHSRLSIAGLCLLDNNININNFAFNNNITLLEKNKTKQNKTKQNK